MPDVAAIAQRRPTALRRITRKLLGLRPPAAPSAPPAPTGRWQSERITADFDMYLRELEQDFAQAKRLILLEMYIFGDDAIGRRVEAALIAAAKRGVEVMVAVDGIGSGVWLERAAGELSRQGVHIRVYHPTPWQLAHFSIPTRQRLESAGRWFRYFNRRNHRKMCIIDGRLAWVGSMNLTHEHSAALMGDSAWRDTVARVEGDGVRVLMRAFIAAWRRSWRVAGLRLYPSFSLRSLHLSQPLDGLVRLNHGLRMRRLYYRDLLARITHARQRVWIANAYFVPQGSLIKALGAAAANGVDVRVIVPAQSDVWFMSYVAATFADALAQVGVRLLYYQPRMLHAKTMLIDDWVSIGSTNLNHRSLRHDLEADVVLTTSASVRAVEKILQEDSAVSLDLTADSHRPPWRVRMIGNAMLLLRRWI